MPLANFPVQGAKAVLPGCEARCPGCSHRKLSQTESLSAKQEWLGHKLVKWASVLQPLQELPDQYRLGYREKSCLHAHWNGTTWDFGFWIRVGRFDYELVPIPNCPVHSVRVHEAIRVCSEILPTLFNDPSRNFPIAFLAVSGALVTIVVKAPLAQSAQMISVLTGEFTKKLDEAGFAGLYLNFNPSAGNRVFAARAWKHVWGKEFGELSLDSGLFQYGPSSFVQVLAETHRQSIRDTEEFLSLRTGMAVVDLCSGVGVTLSVWRKAGAQVLGVELSGEAVTCAKLNLGGEFCLRGKASDRIPQVNSWLDSVENDFVLYVNPPRLGLEHEVLVWLTVRAKRGEGAKKIAYLSCNAITQARDLSELENAGYAVTRIIPYDFFPQTHHVETLATLELRA